MTQVAVIGCGIIGATIAYELSKISGFKITVFDQQPPAQASTGAALGVLMGAISQKAKGKAWKLRQTSLRRYETLIPELEAVIDRPIPFNRQGILLLCFDDCFDDDRSQWQRLIDIRRDQGWHLELWDGDRLDAQCPHISQERVTGAIYSPQDRQVDPTALTLALVEAAKQNGVEFRWGAAVEDLQWQESGDLRHCHTLQTIDETRAIDWVVVAAGLGSTPLTRKAPQPIDIRPVLGQALHVRLAEPLGNPAFQPVITGEDIHIVPLQPGEYWVGATVEFPGESGDVTANSELLETVWQGAIAHCPALRSADILRTWSGLRPRPYNRPAPIIEPLTGYDNVLLATGHYRNGVLLAPATALEVGEAIAPSPLR